VFTFVTKTKPKATKKINLLFYVEYAKISLSAKILISIVGSVLRWKKASVVRR